MLNQKCTVLPVTFAMMPRFDSTNKSIVFLLDMHMKMFFLKMCLTVILLIISYFKGLHFTLFERAFISFNLSFEFIIK